MKTRILLILFFWGGCLALKVNAQDSSSYSSCSGGTLELVTTNATFEGSVFEWAILEDNNYRALDEISTKLEVTLETTQKVINKFRCKYFLNGAVYDSSFYNVTFYPLSNVEIVADNLCLGQFAKLDFTSNGVVETQEWYINGNFQSLNNKLDIYCETDDKLEVNLKVVNENGCETSVFKNLHISTDDQGYVNKTPQFSPKYFIEEMDCGNSVSSYEVLSLDQQTNVVKWGIVVGNETVLEIENYDNLEIQYDIDVLQVVDSWVGNKSLKVKWLPSNSAKTILLTATYSNGQCEYSTIFESILINEEAPDEMELFQKPNSNVLILPKGQTLVNLNYQWGYTDSNGLDDTENMDYNRFYHEYAELDSSKVYWVETWFTSNSNCRVRNFLEEVKSVKAAGLSFRVYPNPLSEFAFVKITNAVNGSIVLNDLTGITLKNIKVYKGQNEYKLDVNGLISGNYLISYRSDSGDIIDSKNIVIK